METNNYFKKAPSSDGYKMQIGCRVPQSVHDRLRDLSHQGRFTSFSAFLETVLTNYDNQQATIELLETRLANAGEVFKKGLDGMQNMQNEARDITELRFFFLNLLLDTLDIDAASRKAVNSELIGDRDRDNLVNILYKAVPEFNGITFSNEEKEHVNEIVRQRIEANMTIDHNHFFRQCVDFSINFNIMKDKHGLFSFSIPEEITKPFLLENAYYDNI